MPTCDPSGWTSFRADGGARGVLARPAVAWPGGDGGAMGPWTRTPAPGGARRRPRPAWPPSWGPGLMTAPPWRAPAMASPRAARPARGVAAVLSFLNTTNPTITQLPAHDPGPAPPSGWSQLKVVGDLKPSGHRSGAVYCSSAPCWRRPLQQLLAVPSAVGRGSRPPPRTWWCRSPPRCTRGPLSDASSAAGRMAIVSWPRTSGTTAPSSVLLPELRRHARRLRGRGDPPGPPRLGTPTCLITARRGHQPPVVGGCPVL